MRAAARSAVFVVASAAPWMASCVGAGDDSIGAMATEGGSDAPRGDGASGDAPAADGTLGDASPGDGATGEVMSSDGPVDVTNAVTTTSSVAGLRVANWSPDAPRVDFCIAPHGSGAFHGPVMAAALGDAGAGALDFPQVSAYSMLAPSAYDVRIVVAAPGADCSLGGLLVKDAPTGMLAAGTGTTLALVGLAHSPGSDSATRLQLLSPFSDLSVVPAPIVPPDGAAVVTQPFATRFIHAAPGLPNVNLVGTATGPSVPNGIGWQINGIPFGHTIPADGGADPNRYQLVAAAMTAVLDLRLSKQAASAPDLFPPPTVSAAAGSVLTMVLAGTASCDAGVCSSATSMGAAVQLLECDDNAGMTTAYSPCRTLSVSTCGNGIKEPFEECDCGNGHGAVIMDSQCSSAMDQNYGNGDLPQICSSTCHLN